MGTTATPATISPQSGEPMSAFSRIVNVFFAPSKTFADLKRDSSWWLAWLLISVFGMLFVFAVQQKVGWDRTVQNMMAENPKAMDRLDKLSPEQKNQQMTMITKSTQYMSYATPIMILIFAAISAGVLLGLMNFGAGAELSFGTALAIVFHSWVPGILKSLLIALTLYGGMDPDSFHLKNPLASNLGFFVDSAAHPALFAIAAGIDIFAIWYVILMGIGFSSVSKVKRSTATWIVGGAYAAFILISAGSAAIFG